MTFQSINTAKARIAQQSHFRKLRLGTPFQPRLDELNVQESWYDWAGYKAPMALWDEELEYFAIRSQAAVFDISPMVKYRIEGKDAEAFLDRLTLRDVTKLKPGRVHYTAWCDDDGHVLDDGTLFRLSADALPPVLPGPPSAVAARQRHRLRRLDRGGNRDRRRPRPARPDLLVGSERSRLCRLGKAEALRHRQLSRMRAAK